MFKACSRCGKIHNMKYKCNVGKVYQGGKERELRATYSWHKKSKQIRNDAQHLCEVCRDHGRYTYNNLEVHHIDKIRDNEDLFLVDENLITLCQYHHHLADSGKIDQDYLRKLAHDRISKYPPGGEIGKLEAGS